MLKCEHSNERGFTVLLCDAVQSFHMVKWPKCEEKLADTIELHCYFVMDCHTV